MHYNSWVRGYKYDILFQLYGLHEALALGFALNISRRGLKDLTLQQPREKYCSSRYRSQKTSAEVKLSFMIKKLTTQCSWKASEWVQCLAALIDCILAVLRSYWLGTWLGSLSHRYALLPICNPRTSQRVHYFASLDMYRIEPYMRALNCGFWGCLRVLESIAFVSEYCVLRIAYCNCVARQRGKNYQSSQIRNTMQSKGSSTDPFRGGPQSCLPQMLILTEMSF